MPESNIDIILRTKRTGNAPEEMKSGLSDLEKTVSGLRTTIAGLDRDISVMGTNVGSVNDLLDGMGISLPVTPMQGFGMALGGVKNLLEESISSYAAYVAEVDKIASFSGMAAEETSRLIQVADDLRIETSSLEMALKTMTTKGTTPSIEGLQRLSNLYLSIQDPLKRAQLLTDNFGRSGVEMARIMELGADKIAELTSEVDNNLIVTEESRQAAEDYIKTLDDWGDAIDGVKYKLAQGLLPELTKLLKFFMDPSSRKAADFINEVFEGTWLESDYSRQQREAESAAPSNPAPPGGGYGPQPPGGWGPPKPGGGRAAGGEVFPGIAYKVGEREVERFVPAVPGYVVPGSTTSQNIQFVYAPIVSLADKAEAERVLKPFIQEALRG